MGAYAVEHVVEELARSRFLASAGDRPASVPVRDPARVGGLVQRLCRATRRELVALHDPVAAAPADETERVRELGLDQEMLRRKVVIRQLNACGDGPPPDRTAEGRVLFCDQVDVRFSPSIPFTLLLFDRVVAVLSLDPEVRGYHHGVLVVRDPVVIGALAAAARTTLAAAAPARPRLPEHLRPVLAAVLDGVVDTTAARRLGLSGRTYTRRVAELVEHLGVRSRAQLGAVAAERGLIG